MLSFCLPALLVSFLISSIPTSVAHSVSKVEAINEREDWNVLLRTFNLENSKDAKNVVIDELKNVVYVGAVNYLYALDLHNVENIRGKMELPPDKESETMCRNYVSNKELCNNVIRILHSVNDTHLYACGTNALEPKCMYINKKTFTREGDLIGGQSKSPADPSSAAVSTMTGGSLFTAIDPNSQHKNGIIEKSPANRDDSGALKTDELESFWLSDPRFVSMFTVPELDSQQEKVVVLFKENAEEIPQEILTQDSDYSVNLVYSRLATICANDRGGSGWFSMADRLATFSKMRLACPVAFEDPSKHRIMPFFYDEIESSYVIPNPQEPDNPSIYAIFSTTKGTHKATATCVYTMRDIRGHMNTLKYWNKPTPDHNQKSPSTPLFDTYEDTAFPPPGSCAADTTQFTIQRATYGNEHPLKFGMIKPKGGFAIYQDSGMTYSHVIVDRIKRKEVFEGIGIDKEYDVVHYITDAGFIKRVVFSVKDRSVNWEIPFRQLFNESDTKDSILTVKKSDKGFIYFGTTSSLIQLKIAACSSYSTCGECKLSNDPYCDWDDLDMACKEIDFSTKRVKHPLKFFTKLNVTGCRVSDAVDNKKQSPDDEPSADSSPLKQQNAQLINQTRVLNQTISKLKKEKQELQTELADNIDKMYYLYNNYTKLSALLLQYNQRRKMVTQLYRDTLHALRDCQEEKSLGKMNVKNTFIALKSHRNTTAGKEKRATDQRRCNCAAENQIAVKHSSRQPSTSSDTSASSRSLTIRVSGLLHARENMTEEIKRLNQTIVDLEHENAKIVATAAGKKQCVGRDQWFPYRPTNKLFLFTQGAVIYSKAIQSCASFGGSLAELKDDGEARFVFNITHSLYQRKRYWVGLRKYSDGSMKWMDGSEYNKAVTPRFSNSQNSRMRSRTEYCVETLHRALQWQLIPCNRHRRLICVKDDVAKM